MAADQGDKAAAFERASVKGAGTPLDKLEFLDLGIAHWENQSPAFIELRLEGRRDRWRGRGNEDGIERRQIRQT